MTLFTYMILKTNISLPLPYLDCIKHCYGEQNSTVNSLHVDDWTAELVIIASKAEGELIYRSDTNQGPFYIAIFSLFLFPRVKIKIRKMCNQWRISFLAIKILMLIPYYRKLEILAMSKVSFVTIF